MVFRYLSVLVTILPTAIPLHARILTVGLVFAAAHGAPAFSNSQRVLKDDDVNRAIERSFAHKGSVISLSKHKNANSCREMLDVMKPVVGDVRRYDFTLQLHKSVSVKEIVVCVNSEPSGVVSWEYYPASVFAQ